MSKRPNILLITSDQQQWRALGSVDPNLRTPNLDRLARSGVRFDRAYCPNPTCTPTRASIITGMYPSRHGAYTLGTKLPEDVPTVGDALRRAGYETSLIGKAHFQPLKSTDEQPSVEAYPGLRDLEYWSTFNRDRTPWYGFDHVELARNHADEGHVGQHYAIWMRDNGLADWPAYFQPRTDGVSVPGEASKAPVVVGGPGYGWRAYAPWQLPARHHYTTFTGERTIAAIDRAVAQGKPFFAWSSYHDPHPPYCVPEPWFSMYDPAKMELRRYADGEFDRMPLPHRMTRDPAADFGPFGPNNHGYHPHVGVSEELMRQSIAMYFGMISFMDDQIGKTLDHLERIGELENTLVVFTSDHGHFMGEHGLIAKGPFHYEEVVRVPFIASMPGTIAPGGPSNAIQSLVDLAPTFLEAAGLEVPRRMQGKAQLQHWATGSSARTTAMIENHHQEDGRVHLRTIVDARYKLTVYRNREWGELFDLQEDPRELNNLFDDPNHAGVRDRMLRKMIDHDLDREPAEAQRQSGA